MEKILDSRDWNSHKFLSRLTVRSDIDGDAAYCLMDPSDDDLARAVQVHIEFKRPGRDWERAPFAESASFVWGRGLAWFFPTNLHPQMVVYNNTELSHIAEEVNNLLVRAIVVE